MSSHLQDSAIDAKYVAFLKNSSIILGVTVFCLSLFGIFILNTEFFSFKMPSRFSLLGFMALSFCFLLFHFRKDFVVLKYVVLLLGIVLFFSPFWLLKTVENEKAFNILPKGWILPTLFARTATLLLSIAFFFLNFRKTIKLGQIIAFFTNALSLLLLCTFVFYHLYGSAALFAPEIKAISIVSLLLLSFQLLFSNPDEGYGLLFVNKYFVGKMLRLQIPAIAIVTLILGIIRFLGEKYGYYRTPFGISLMIVCSICFATIIVCRAGTILEIFDSQRREGEKIIQSLNQNLEKRISERTHQLETVNQELEAFSYSVAHDLRAPLRAIDGFSHLFLEKYGENIPEEGLAYLNRVCKGSQDMGTLIDDLLAFSRISRQPLKKEKIKTEKMVREVISKIENDACNRKVALTIQPLTDCYGDPHLIFQVFFNLISNAYKFSSKKDQPTILIGEERQNERNVYYIKDNGAGFDMRYSPKLFGVFQRLHSNEDFPGNGVGLASVKKIIEKHGGRIWADSMINQGTTFYFYILDAFEETGHK